jgi:predicted permease
MNDLRLAARALARKPGITGLALLSLALAIGFSTTGFSVLDAMLLRSAPVRDPASLASIVAITGEQRFDALSWAEYLALSAHAHSFTAIVAEDRQGPAVRLPDGMDFPITAEVSDNYFDVLGISAARGDVFHTARGGDHTLVISDRYWKRQLAGDPAILGRVLQVGKGMVRVIGVLPPGFRGENRGLTVDLFAPLQTVFGTLGTIDPADRRSTDFELLGRLRPHVTLEQARGEVDAILRQVETDGAAPGPQRHALVHAFEEDRLPIKIVFLASLALLLVIAAANVANLRLVDNESRRREIFIRMALGGGPAALARAHLIETLLLSVTGAAGGLLVAAWLVRLLPGLFSGGQRYIDLGIRLDARSFAFTSAALLLVTSISALIPLRDAWKRRVLSGLQGSRFTRSSRWLSVLVIAQMAMVTGLTCSSALLWRSLRNVSAIRPAMDPDRKLLLLEGFWDTSAGVPGRTEGLAARMAQVPGVRQVAWARRALLSGSGGGAVVPVEMAGQPKSSLAFDQVSPNYFAVTGARILAGRPFQESDAADSTLVVMVNAAFVRQFLRERQPLGQWVKVSGKDRQVVGIVEDGPTIHLREPLQPYLYLPFAQQPSGGVTFFVETARDPAALAGPVRSTARQADRAYTILQIVTMAQHMNAACSEEILAADLTGGLAVLGLLLAGAGLFGISLFAVARRTPEFGVRMAIGATPSRLLAQVLAESGRQVAVAIALGWLLGYAFRHALESLLYGVAADDPWTYLAASALVAAIACCAALEPAIRAARIDPMAALRHE